MFQSIFYWTPMSCFCVFLTRLDLNLDLIYRNREGTLRVRDSLHSRGFITDVKWACLKVWRRCPLAKTTGHMRRKLVFCAAISNLVFSCDDRKCRRKLSHLRWTKDKAVIKVSMFQVAVTRFCKTNKNMP